MTNLLPFPNALRGRLLAVVDIEGNGQNPPEIIEIAVLPVDGSIAPNALRSWLIQPQRPVNPLVTRKVHGISNSDLAGCPSWSAVAEEVLEVLDGRTLVAHNASVERNVLAAHLPDWDPPFILDTLRLAKHVWQGLDSYKLGALIERGELDMSNVSGQAYHRAAYDTWAAWQLLCALVTDGRMDWPDVIAAARTAGPVPEGQDGLW